WYGLESAERRNYRHGFADCRSRERQRKVIAAANVQPFPRRGQPCLRGFTMSDVSTVAEVAEVDTQDAPEQDTQDAPEQDERQLNALLRKAESAFTRGNKGLLLSRVECGKWCHAV